MHVVGLFFVAGLTFSSVSAQDQAPANVSKIQRFLFDRCKVYSTDAAVFDDIRTHFGQFSDYLNYAASLLPKGKQQFCEDERPKLVGLARALSMESKACMPNEEKYLPSYIYYGFAHFLNFACEGRNMESFFSTTGSSCRANLIEHSAGEEVGNCFKKAFVRFERTVPRDDFCKDLESAKRCFSEALNRHCSDFQAYRTLNDRFFDAVMFKCKDSAVSLGLSMILLIVAFVSTKVF